MSTSMQLFYLIYTGRYFS